MTDRRLYYLAAARLEAVEAFNWYFQRSEQAASAFLHELEHAIELIAESPQVWPVFERETRRCVLRRYPFSVIYREKGDAIEVIAVAHHKRTWLLAFAARRLTHQCNGRRRAELDPPV
jgi:plasmid stabilization system protein ParE